MDYLSLIQRPIQAELADFIALFQASLDHSDGLLAQALAHIRGKGGKRMRPMLILLMARNFGSVSSVTQHAAVGLELLHTASLVHDDVVDESGERRGQASVNATYNNKVAVLVGDYIQNQQISEEAYYEIIKRKTAALFEACAAIGAESAGADGEAVAAAALFGQNLGVMFQIRDDIFDYYDNAEIGKPTGNDMAEGKLTLPVIHALNTTGDADMAALARKVKARTVTPDEIARLVAFTKAHGGIEYAERRMRDFHTACMRFVDERVGDTAIREALTAYLDFVIERRS